MIELTLGKLRDFEFQRGMSKLVGAQTLEFKTSYHISRIWKKIQSESSIAQEAFNKLVKKFGDVDEKTGQFQIKPEHIDTWTKELEEFNNTVFVVEKHKVNVATLDGVKLSPAEILALEPVLHGLEVLEGGKDGKEES